jgi:hypothetical protein
MLPVMTMNATQRSRVLNGERVRVKLPDGRSAMVWTKMDRERGRIVVVKPIRTSEE